MQQLPQALGALALWPQFIVYQLKPNPANPAKTVKLPCNRQGYTSSAMDASNWSSHEKAIEDAKSLGSGYGVGYVFTKADPFWFIDIDSCLTEAGWSPIALELCGVFTGCAIEVSQSGRGLHIIGQGQAPAHGCKNIALGLEFYTEDRFVALTGNGAIGDAATVAPEGALDWLTRSYFSTGEGSGTELGWTSSPCLEWRGPTDDAELIRRACNSQSARAAFGGTASFRDLWEGNVDALARAYPDPDATSGRAYDASSADAALFAHLSFWTGKDCERMLRLGMQSALVRDKWNREDYIQRTILGACARGGAVLSDKEVETPRADVELPPNESGYEPAEMRVRQGASFLNIESQANLFRGCVYVSAENRVLTPGGMLLKPEQFKVSYGGHTFSMDAANERTTRDAWEAFTQSQVLRPPIADRTAFRPAAPPGAVIKEPGRVVVNTYWPITVARAVGDATPFMRHMELLFPNARDREILLCYMAALVQYKGYKFQWAPIIQGVQGNGKTLLARCVAESIGGGHCFWPDAAGLESDFNGWLENVIFVGVEEIKVAEHQAKMIEKLKVMITGGHGQQIQRKGYDQETKDICANFMFTTNYKNALPLDENDRRFAVFFTNHQHVSDLVRDGIDKRTDYFPRLYEWLRDEGYAIVAELLHTYPINPEFNPAGKCQRAPDTTSTQLAIKESASVLEQDITEAIESGLPGFKGGFVSSKALDTLVRDTRSRASYGRRREVLHKMGYEYHPGLVDGRTATVVLPDGMKPRLFAKKGSPVWGLTGPRVIADAYMDAQKAVETA